MMSCSAWADTTTQSSLPSWFDKVRAAQPHAAICLDVITGFPGETDREFFGCF